MLFPLLISSIRDLVVAVGGGILGALLYVAHPIVRLSGLAPVTGAVPSSL